MVKHLTCATNHSSASSQSSPAIVRDKRVTQKHTPFSVDSTGHNRQPSSSQKQSPQAQRPTRLPLPLHLFPNTATQVTPPNLQNTKTAFRGTKRSPRSSQDRPQRSQTEGRPRPPPKAFRATADMPRQPSQQSRSLSKIPRPSQDCPSRRQGIKHVIPLEKYAFFCTTFPHPWLRVCFFVRLTFSFLLILSSSS